MLKGTWGLVFKVTFWIAVLIITYSPIKVLIAILAQSPMILQSSKYCGNIIECFSVWGFEDLGAGDVPRDSKLHYLRKYT